MLRVVRVNEPVYAQFAGRRTHAAGGGVCGGTGAGTGCRQQHAAGQNPDGSAGWLVAVGVFIFI